MSRSCPWPPPIRGTASAQTQALERAKAVFPQLARMEALYANTGIETRYSCEPHEWCQQPHGWEERTETYQRHALTLLEEVAVEAVAEAGLGARRHRRHRRQHHHRARHPEPRCDADEPARLPRRRRAAADLRSGLRRRGCADSRARRGLRRRMPGANVLFLTVDLCTCARAPTIRAWPCSFRRRCSATVRRASCCAAARGGGEVAPVAGLPRIRAIGEHCWPNTEHIMGWDIKDDGFGVVLSPELPSLMRESCGRRWRLSSRATVWSSETSTGFLFHPGGRKVLETAEEALGIERERLAHSWEVLRDYGNMSSATALFVLERALRRAPRACISWPRSVRASRPTSRPSSFDALDRRPLRQRPVLEQDLVVEHRAPDGSQDHRDRQPANTSGSRNVSAIVTA